MKCQVLFFKQTRDWINQCYPCPGLQGLTLKMPRKPASENVVCLCHLLNILANFSNLFFACRQTVWTQIRLLLDDDNCCDWQFKG